MYFLTCILNYTLYFAFWGYRVTTDNGEWIKDNVLENVNLLCNNLYHKKCNTNKLEFNYWKLLPFSRYFSYSVLTDQQLQVQATHKVFHK